MINDIVSGMSITHKNDILEEYYMLFVNEHLGETIWNYVYSVFGKDDKITNKLFPSSLLKSPFLDLSFWLLFLTIFSSWTVTVRPYVCSRQDKGGKYVKKIKEA